jgi:formamidopyrimidine-DNA glycosylase
MPELPEVESVRRSLEPCLTGRGVTRVECRRRDVVVAPGDPPGGFSRHRGHARPVPIVPGMLLEGRTIRGLDRRGKQLALLTDSGPALIVHLGMTGRLEHTTGGDDPPHTHLVWVLDDGSRLRFADPRRFGLVRIAPAGPAPLWAELGPDALTIGARTLHGAVCRSRRAIKAILLDQAVLAGVGNIYADEALHASGVHPARPGASLDAAETGRLAREIRGVLGRAVRAGGSTVRDYRDGAGRPGSYQHRHRVYGRGGLACVSCGGVLEQGTIAQRTTVWCPRCQPPG